MKKDSPHTPKHRALMLRAATLLASEALAARESCEGNNGDWACGNCKKDERGRCKAMREHERLTETAEELRRAAR